jgi:DNA gyrase/topoisomerase IV subunit B
MAIARFFVHLVPEFEDQKKTKLNRIKADKLVQNNPAPDTVGMWIEINIEVPDAVFKNLVPRLNARLNEKAIEAMLAESSDLHARVVGVEADFDT